MRYRVIVAAHEIVQAGFRIEIIASVSEGIQVADVVLICYSIAAAVLYGKDIFENRFLMMLFYSATLQAVPSA